MNFIMIGLLLREQRCCKYQSHKYKYKYKYLKLTIKYNPSTGTR